MALQRDVFPRVVTDTETALGDADYAEHLRTYRYFVKGTVLFAAHALLILLLALLFRRLIPPEANVHQNLTSREQKAKRLAKRMYFTLTREGDRYSLCRTVGLSGPARRENLSLEEVEQELEKWKLRGYHGG